MHYTMIERSPDTHQQPLTGAQISAMCECAFEPAKEIATIQELGGGECNNTYLITFTDNLKVILRVSPAPDKPCPGRSSAPMRNEYYFQPFFAPVATLMPKTLLADFTHELIKRDYMFQTFMEGERWSDIIEQLSPEENTALWQQLGHIAKRIHSIPGETFGSPFAGKTFTHWSTKVIDDLTRRIQQLEVVQIDATDVKIVRELAEQHSDLLDEIRQPYLLHGDLWAFNVLVKRDQGNPRITAVLDSDGASWGDPMDDWMMFLLYVKATESTKRNEIEGAQVFWQAYGQPEKSRGAIFRDQIYRASNFAGGRLENHLQGRNNIVLRTYDKLHDIIATLQDIV